MVSSLRLNNHPGHWCISPTTTPRWQTSVGSPKLTGSYILGPKQLCRIPSKLSKSAAAGEHTDRQTGRQMHVPCCAVAMRPMKWLSFLYGLLCAAKFTANNKCVTLTAADSSIDTATTGVTNTTTTDTAVSVTSNSTL